MGVGAERSWRVKLLGIITPARMMGGWKMTPQFLARTGVSRVEEFMGNGEEERVCCLCDICICKSGGLKERAQPESQISESSVCGARDV